MKEQLIPKVSQVITNTTQGTEYNLYLHGPIGDPDDFMEHFAVYKTANEHDFIRLWLCSPGGSLATGMQYIRHMRECAAPIVAVIGMEVASMASAIALEADEIEVDDMSTLLIHSFSYGAYGTEFSVYNQAAFNKKLNERWVRNHYTSFLSEEQISDALKGIDILLTSEEILDCWKNLQVARMEEQEGLSEQIQEHKSLDQMIEEAVSSFYKKLKKDFEITPKVKATKATKSPSPATA